MTVLRHAESPTSQLFSVGPILVNHYSGPPDLPTLDAVEAAARQLAAEHGKLSLLIVIDSKEATVPPEARDRIAKAFTDLSSSLLSVAYVVRMSGLKGSMVRMFVTGVLLLSRLGAPYKVLGSVEEASASIAQVPGQPASIKSLAAEAIATLPPAPSR